MTRGYGPEQQQKQKRGGDEEDDNAGATGATQDGSGGRGGRGGRGGEAGGRARGPAVRDEAVPTAGVITAPAARGVSQRGGLIQTNAQRQAGQGRGAGGRGRGAGAAPSEGGNTTGIVSRITSRRTSVGSRASSRVRAPSNYSVTSTGTDRHRIEPGLRNADGKSCAAVSVFTALKYSFTEQELRQWKLYSEQDMMAKKGDIYCASDLTEALLKDKLKGKHCVTPLDCNCGITVKKNQVLANYIAPHNLDRVPDAQAVLSSLSTCQPSVCPKCGTGGTVATTFTPCSNHLIISLEDARKHDPRVGIGEPNSLPFLEDNKRGTLYHGASLRYEGVSWSITAAVCHVGPREGGHYFAMMPRGDSLLVVDGDRPVMPVKHAMKKAMWKTAVLLFLVRLSYTPLDLPTGATTETDVRDWLRNVATAPTTAATADATAAVTATTTTSGPPMVPLTAPTPVPMLTTSSAAASAAAASAIATTQKKRTVLATLASTVRPPPLAQHDVVDAERISPSKRRRDDGQSDGEGREDAEPFRPTSPQRGKFAETSPTTQDQLRRTTGFGWDKGSSFSI